MAFSMSTKFSTAAPTVRRTAAVAPRTSVRANYKVTVRMPTGKEASFECAPDQVVLEAAEAAGVELPFMCRTNTCCTCAAKCTKGELEMPEQGLLSPEHKAAGFRLLCSAYPRSDIEIMSHQEDEFINTSHIYDKQMNLAGAV